MRDPTILPKREVDLLIVGQGLAGTLLADALMRKGHSFHMIDKRMPGTASQVAAGIINPITGRRFLKSWRFDDLLPVAKEVYARLEHDLGIKVFRRMPLLRSIFSVREENDWLARSADPLYADYIRETADLGNYKGLLQPARGYGEVLQAGQVDLSALLDAFRERLVGKGWITNARFDPAQLFLEKEKISYGALRARFVCFCEGYRGAENPWFGHLPFKGDKGDVLIVRFPEARFDRILKHKVFIVPLPDQKYWVGSTYVHRFDEPGPLPDGRRILEERLRETVRTPFVVEQHLAAVRPTVSDRRPLIGRHPEEPRLLIFNGLGTKGASLGPFWARHMVDFIFRDSQLDPEVDISRFG